MSVNCSQATVELILQEEPNLRRVARRLTRCEPDCDDLVQETLLRAYHARDRFRPGSSVRAWTTTILRRLFLTGAIRTKRRGLQNDTDAGGPLESVSGPAWARDEAPADVPALCDLLEDAVKRALERVPEVYQTAFFLSVVRDLSSDEIGRQLCVPSGTVTSRIHRARERLRCDLAEHRRTLMFGGARGRR